MMTDKITIKKYANRRLYDTLKSEYITLDQVAEMILQGSQVAVFDARTKEDVTAFVLSQIIMEKARKKNFLLPVPLLHLIIRYGDNVLGEFFEKYLEQTINGYLIHKSAVDEQFSQWLKMGVGFTDMVQKTLSGLAPFRDQSGASADTGSDTEDKP